MASFCLVWCPARTRSWKRWPAPDCLEKTAGYGSRVAVELAHPLLIRPVPDVDQAITAHRGKGVVLCVEGDGVDWVNVLETFLNSVGCASPIQAASVLISHLIGFQNNRKTVLDSARFCVINC